MYIRTCTWMSVPLATAKFHVTQHTEKRNHWTQRKFTENLVLV